MTQPEDIPENASRDVTTAANSDHQVWAELLEDGVRGPLAQLVHL
jgi:hypothetical protein